MTEAEWLGCDNPQKLLKFVQKSGKGPATKPGGYSGPQSAAASGRC